MPYKRDPLFEVLFQRCLLPLLIVGGLVVAVIGGYRTTQARAHCRQLAEDRGYAEGSIVPNKYGPDQCVCRGRRNAAGEMDMTISESTPLQ